MNNPFGPLPDPPKKRGSWAKGRPRPEGAGRMRRGLKVTSMYVDPQMLEQLRQLYPGESMADIMRFAMLYLLKHRPQIDRGTRFIEDEDE